MATSHKVLIVDDSALMRQLLTRILSSDPELKVVGAAGDPYAAQEKIKALNPDVLTLDVEMPRMDGPTFLEKLMRGHPMPVVMISSLTDKGADRTLRALSLGAIDYVSKPKLEMRQSLVRDSPIVPRHPFPRRRRLLLRHLGTSICFLLDREIDCP